MTDDDRKALTDLNLRIGQYESEGDWKSLRDCLAIQQLRSGGEKPVLAFRRANGAVVDAQAFLDAVAKSAQRTTAILSITAEGDNVATVRCLVTMGDAQYLNVRLFVRNDGGADWRLLAWANEAAATR
jgi:hypothetical protein